MTRQHAAIQRCGFNKRLHCRRNRTPVGANSQSRLPEHMVAVNRTSYIRLEMKSEEQCRPNKCFFTMSTVDKVGLNGIQCTRRIHAEERKR